MSDETKAPETPLATFSKKEDGIYLGEERVSSLPDVRGNLRMEKGKTGLRKAVEDFVAGVTPVFPSPITPEVVKDLGISATEVTLIPEKPPVAEEKPPVAEEEPFLDLPQAPPPTPSTAPVVAPPAAKPASEKIPDKPLGSPYLGDHDPILREWYREYDPETYFKRYQRPA